MSCVDNCFIYTLLENKKLCSFYYWGIDCLGNCLDSSIWSYAYELTMHTFEITNEAYSERNNSIM